MAMRTCTGCGEEKPLTAEYFYRDRRSVSGYCSGCKICCLAYRQKNSERERARVKKWREENPDYRKTYYAVNREKELAQRKKRREENPEKFRARGKKWREENREKVRANDKKYREENREKVRARWKKWREKNPQYERNRRCTDPTYKLHHNLRAGLCCCLRGKAKKSYTLEYIGLDAEQVWEHLESKFTDGMTRENYGEWHIDHIRPLCSFDFDQFKQGSEEYENLIHEAWHYTNLQPLWAKDNRSKSGKWEAEEGVELGVE
jgi:hypothetical protein